MTEFAYSGCMVPGMTSGNDYRESNFQGGDPGLNYRFYESEDNENNYAGSQLLNEEEGFTLFPCRKSCKEKLGGKGPGFRDCLRECRGKGPRKSKQAAMDAALQAQAIAALSANDTARQKETGGSKTLIWIVLGVVVLIGVGVGIYFLARKKAE
jgi:LPXTG-motif cell wall-anchored protein